ncbi:HlyD family type I secretion periplasmic adaptor subunit [Mesorhizobium sp. Z1-4]|uniref:HlyD family type I secretion periplasmic adaptor subunit n=1 Tax=Mesorhizobium sp. Z1-4 TaxID=2448478 RepID=UPI000FD80D24|nr:HlyD family type I secretion periplasmic adaptor subunit [Mesorhizobium sp. Z1-4]
MRERIKDRPPLAARLVVWIVVLLIGTFVAWAAIARVDEIARGEGKVIPLSKTQIIQASEAGVVQEIAVRVGQVVRAGDLILRLDDTTTTSSLGESQARANALRTRIERLDLEIAVDLERSFKCSDKLAAANPAICANEAAVFQARRENFQNKADVLGARADQRSLELQEAETNIEQLQKVIEAMDREVQMIEPLVKKRLHAETDLLRLERELAEKKGQLSVAQKSLGRLRAAIREAELQQVELRLQLEQEARTEKSELLSDLNVLEETIRGASDRVRRTDIRSPVDGIVNTLDINTIGAFVQPGTVIGGVVPTSDALLIEARISPRDVAFVRPGQSALVKVTAYDFSVFGGLDGDVSNISADSLVDAETGETYYQVYVKTDESGIVKDGRTHLIIPGMVASVEIMTGQKTVLDYLMKPINKAKNEALTER